MNGGQEVTYINTVLICGFLKKNLKGKIMTLCTVTEVLHKTESAEAYLKLHFQELER